MNTYDFSPFFRSTIGFDRVFDLLDSARSEENGYPPYNIEKLGEDTYRITMAVAGFAPEELSVVAQENVLTVSAKQKEATDGQKPQFLYRGIAGRTFERRFNLADYVKVTGANLANGLLHVELKREVPEAVKPRTISIQSGPAAKVLEAKAA
jgi:molecular chaperone IbpA